MWLLQQHPAQIYTYLLDIAFNEDATYIELVTLAFAIGVFWMITLETAKPIIRYFTYDKPWLRQAMEREFERSDKKQLERLANQRRKRSILKKVWKIGRVELLCASSTLQERYSVFLYWYVMMYSSLCTLYYSGDLDSIHFFFVHLPHYSSVKAINHGRHLWHVVAGYLKRDLMWVVWYYTSSDAISFSYKINPLTYLLHGLQLLDTARYFYIRFFTKDGKKKLPTTMLVLLVLHHSLSVTLVPSMIMRYRYLRAFHWLVFELQIAGGLTIIGVYSQLLDISQPGDLRQFKALNTFFLAFMWVVCVIHMMQWFALSWFSIYCCIIIGFGRDWFIGFSYVMKLWWYGSTIKHGL